MTTKLIKQYTLPIAMVIGVLAYPYISKVSVLSPYLISVILFLTFTGLSPKQLVFSKSQILLLIIQIVGSILVYAALAPYSVILAQGAMMCVLIPTATAAPIATKLLGGNVGYVTTYLFLSNVIMAILTPIFFSLITDSELSFFDTFIGIIKRIGSLLVVPLLIVWTIRYLAPTIHTKLEKLSFLAFPIWAIALMIATSSTVNFFVTQPTKNYFILIIMALLAIILALVQIYIGKRVGKGSDNSIACAQALGQKNTIMAIWMAQTFLIPISSIIPAIYVISQNIINSYNIWKKEQTNGKI